MKGASHSVSHRTILRVAIFMLFATTAVSTAFGLDLIVDTTVDSWTLTACDPSVPNDCSLRGAFSRSNSNGQSDSITFSVAGPFILSLGQIDVNNGSNPTTLSGGTGSTPGLVEISNPNGSRVFEVRGGGGFIAEHIRFSNSGSTAAGYRGGAILVSANNAKLTVRDSEFVGNRAESGGAIRIDANSIGADIFRSTFENNQAVLGGGAISANDVMYLRNSTLTGNTVSSGSGTGGAISITSDVTGTLSVTLDSLTITGNSAATGRGIYSAGNYTLQNSIVSANGTGSVSDIAGNPPTAGTNNLTSNVVTSLNLGTLGDYGGPTRTIPLLPGSVAIDTGATALTIDQRYRLRPAGAADDIGAFEYLGPTAAGISVGGRVTTADGRGVSNAAVFLTDGNGLVRRVQTSPFGYFRFDDVVAGTHVVITVESKRYVFEAKSVSVMDQIADLAIIGVPR